MANIEFTDYPACSISTIAITRLLRTIGPGLFGVVQCEGPTE